MVAFSSLFLSVMENRDENLDVLLLICQLLPQKQRLRVSRVSKGWHQAAISATRSLKATVNQAKAPVSAPGPDCAGAAVVMLLARTHTE